MCLNAEAGGLTVWRDAHVRFFDLLQYEYALRHLYVLANLCEKPYPIDR